MIRVLLILFLLVNTALGVEDISHVVWNMKWNIINFLIVLFFVLRLLKNKLIEKFSIERESFLKESQENLNQLEEVNNKILSTQGKMGDLPALLKLQEEKTIESIQKYQKLKKQQIIERENQLKSEYAQRKNNLDFRLMQELYYKIMGGIVKSTKEEVREKKELKNKVEEILLQD